jgi:hypothetical protein
LAAAQHQEGSAFCSGGEQCLSADAFRPLRLQAAGEKPGEGNPADPGQARMQVSIHEQGGGASVGPKGARSSLPALQDIT